MSNEKKIDSSFQNGYSIEEVMAVEAGKYVIQVGNDLLTSETGKMAFDKDRADELYEQVLIGLKDMKKSNNQQEKDDALYCLKHLRMFPLRIH